MGKYMRRKCRRVTRAGATTAVERRAQVVVVGGGVRTRSRSAAAVSKRRQQATTARVAAVEEALRRDVDGGAAGCYLHLRSRRLFMAVAAVVAPRGRGPGSEEVPPPPVVADSGSGEVVVAGISRCSSTASSVDVAAVRETERSGGEAEACESRDVEKSSVSSRDRRETTPSSDVESSRQVAGEQKHQRRSSPSSVTFYAVARARSTRMPPASEIEEFFAAAEKAAAERFAARYNFDVTHGVPLNGGRFEWTPVAGGCGGARYVQKHAKRLEARTYVGRPGRDPPSTEM